MDQATAKQQVVERIKQANNILVTVSNNPSVDQLSACIGMTLFLNKLEKHATAVYSGKTPPAIEFLQPEKTLEPNTDSLRDFIISLDKAKADKLRYKVEDKFVRIYITPYRTSIGEKDLVFSEGDFNVDVVLALGVRDKAQLDAAITQHGRILHDATVISVNSGQEKAPDIGQINWQEPAASSLSEMLVSISEAFGTGLIDNQMATAFLTGIVAETDRFSNTKTSPKVMTMAAQLMAAGANQQLIVSKLEPPPPDTAKPVKPPGPPKAPPSDTLRVSHQEGQQDSPEVEVKPDEIHIDEEGNIVPPKENKVVTPPQEAPAPPPAMAFEPLKSEPVVTPAKPERPEPAAELHTKPNLNLPEPRPKLDIPEPGPAPEAHELLDPTDHKPSISPPFSADTQPFWYDPENSLPMDPLSEAARPNDAILRHDNLSHDSGSESTKTVKPPAMQAGLSSETSIFPEPENAPTPTFSTPPLDNVRNAVDAAIAAAPFNPAIEGPIKALNAAPLPAAEKPAQPAAVQQAGPAPPPVPPPLKLDSGVVIPTSANLAAPVTSSTANQPTFTLPKIL
ncbi:hypothetical protein HYU82_01020 [Candidatus Saccharibacteria bacterium]|nr:hypothetical protein [Candidatus Saccharibacteria bacterium]